MRSNTTLETNFRCLGKAIVTKDKEEDAYEVEVHLVEAMPSLEGDYNEVENKNFSYVDANNQTVSVQKDKSKTITAKWIGLYNSNRISAPDVVIGEMVYIFQEGGNDEYFWASTSMNMRKKEKVIYSYANKNDSMVNEESGDKQYYLVVDTKNKEIVLHTDSSDGEYTTYDIVINTKDGKVAIKDGKNNYIELDSSNDTYTLNMNNNYLGVVTNNYDINCNNFSVNNSSNELIQVLMDFTDVCRNEVHSESIGTYTTVSGQTRSQLARIKSRLATFKNGAGYISTSPGKANTPGNTPEGVNVLEGKNTTVNMYKDPSGHVTKDSTSKVGSDAYGDVYEQNYPDYSNYGSSNPGGVDYNLEGGMNVNSETINNNTKIINNNTESINNKSDSIVNTSNKMTNTIGSLDNNIDNVFNTNKEVINKVSGTITNTADSIVNNVSSFINNSTSFISNSTGKFETTSNGLSITSNGEELLNLLTEFLDILTEDDQDYEVSGDTIPDPIKVKTKMSQELKDKYTKLKERIEKMK